MGKTHDDEIYEQGVHDGQQGGFLDDFVHKNAPRIFPTRESEIYDKGYDYGADHRYDSDDSSSGSSSDSSGCFVTTACVLARGLPENCRELVALRRLRDAHMVSTPQGRAEVALYYHMAPQIVEAIWRSPNPQAELDFIYETCVVPSVLLIESDQFEEASKYYGEHLRTLAARYGIAIEAC